MRNALFDILVLSFIGSLAGLIGGVVFLAKENWSRVLCRYAIPFAAGVLLSVSLLDLLPEAAENVGGLAYTIALVALVASFLFEQFFVQLHHHEEGTRARPKLPVQLVVLGDTIHNFVDGVAIAAAYLVEPSFGLIVAFASFLHETPHEIGDFGVLISAGWSKKRTFLANFFSALATFPGALFVLYYFEGFPRAIGALLAVSAGIFLYLGASDFLPEIEEGSVAFTRKRILVFLIGITVMFVLTQILPA